MKSHRSRDSRVWEVGFLQDGKESRPNAAVSGQQDILMQRESEEKVHSASLMVVRCSGESANCLKERRIKWERRIRKISDYSTGQGIFSAHSSLLGSRLFGASAVKEFLTASANRVNCYS